MDNISRIIFFSAAMEPCNITGNIAYRIGSAPRIINNSRVIPDSTIAQPYILCACSGKFSGKRRVSCSKSKVNGSTRSIPLCHCCGMSLDFNRICSCISHIAFFISQHIDINTCCFPHSPHGIILFGNEFAAAHTDITFIVSGKHGSGATLGFDIYKTFDLNRISCAIRLCIDFQGTVVHFISWRRNPSADFYRMLRLVIIINHHMGPFIRWLCRRHTDAAAIIIINIGQETDRPRIIKSDSSLSVSANAGRCPHRLRTGRACRRRNIRFNIQVMALHIYRIRRASFRLGAASTPAASVFIIAEIIYSCYIQSTPAKIARILCHFVYNRSITVKRIFQISINIRYIFFIRLIIIRIPEDNSRERILCQRSFMPLPRCFIPLNSAK